MHHSVTRNELLNIIFHVLLEFQRKIAQMEVTFFVIPRNDLGTWTLLGVLADPAGNLIISSASSNQRPKVIIINFGKFQPALIEWAVGMVLPFPACKHCTAFVHGARRQYVASEGLSRTARKFFPIAPIARQQLHLFEALIHRVF